jgi:hypothetical protein
MIAQLLPLLLLFVVALADRPAPNLLSPRYALPIVIVLSVAAFLYSLWNWRCPACQKYLWRERWWSKRCSHCDVPLRD